MSVLKSVESEYFVITEGNHGSAKVLPSYVTWPWWVTIDVLTSSSAEITDSVEDNVTVPSTLLMNPWESLTTISTSDAPLEKVSIIAALANGESAINATSDNARRTLETSDILPLISPERWLA